MVSWHSQAVNWNVAKSTRKFCLNSQKGRQCNRVFFFRAGERDVTGNDEYRNCNVRHFVGNCWSDFVQAR